MEGSDGEEDTLGRVAGFIDIACSSPCWGSFWESGGLVTEISSSRGYRGSKCEIRKRSLGRGDARLGIPGSGECYFWGVRVKGYLIRPLLFPLVLWNREIWRVLEDINEV